MSKLRVPQPHAATRWALMSEFKKTRQRVEADVKYRTYIRYFLMMRRSGDMVANWYVSAYSGWYFGDPKEFVAWAEVIEPVEELRRV